MAMANGTKYADAMTEARVERIKAIVSATDAYKACPVPKQQEVQEFLVDSAASTHEYLKGLSVALKTNGNSAKGLNLKAFGVDAEVSLAAVSEIIKHGGMFAIIVLIGWLMWTLNRPLPAKPADNTTTAKQPTMLNRFAMIAAEHRAATAESHE
jgi:hypothetical protein